MTKETFDKNARILEDNGLVISGKGWEDLPFSAELEGYTDAGEDMVFALEELSAAELEEYIAGFDINYEVSLHWPNGRKAKGVPFDNIKEHYEDYEKWLEYLSTIAELMD